MNDEALKDGVVIVGGRVAGNLSAAYLRKRFPDLPIVVIDRSEKAPPLVGESTIEGTTLFLHECGLAKLLQEKHFHKFGLTFYFKLDREHPEDRRYAIHEEPAIPPLPANLVNRFTFDRDVRAINESHGVEYRTGQVTHVECGRGRHVVRYTDASGAERTTVCRWLVDASGRHRLLAKKLSLSEKPAYQRSSFWFRLADFDPAILLGLNAAMRGRYAQMRDQIAYDPYYVTHHFMGHGNWIWCIPVATEDDRRLISIGITYRPDVYGGVVKDIDDFMNRTAREHPVVTDLVASGRVADTNVLHNYMYFTRQHYSQDGWFVVGDAANAVDPLYSTGMFLIATQIGQVAAIIGAAREGRPIGDLARDFDTMMRALYQRAQTIIARHYEVMGDPVQSHLRVHWMTTIYFYFALPFFMSGYHTDPKGVRLMAHLINESEKPEQSAWELFRVASKQVGRPDVEHVFNWYNDTINYRLLTAKEHDLPVHLARMSFLFARMRFEALRRARWVDSARQLREIGRDLSMGLLLRTMFRKSNLRHSNAFQLLVGAGAP